MWREAVTHHEGGEGEGRSQNRADEGLLSRAGEGRALAGQVKVLVGQGRSRCL